MKLDAILHAQKKNWQLEIIVSQKRRIRTEKSSI